MTQVRTKGFNIILELDGKKVAGTTANSLGIKPKLKESLIKDDLGTSQKEQTGYDSDLSISGLVVLDDSNSPAQLDVDYLIDAALAGTWIPFVYSRVGTTVTREGLLIINDYKEDSDSENIATYSASCSVVGALEKGTLT